MGFYKELDIERIHQEEETAEVLASMQITLNEVFDKKPEPQQSLAFFLGYKKYEFVPESQYN